MRHSVCVEQFRAGEDAVDGCGSDGVHAWMFASCTVYACACSSALKVVYCFHLVRVRVTLCVCVEQVRAGEDAGVRVIYMQ